MSDENKTQPTPPPTPVAKTSAVPLKKETVRITLRARPGAGVTQAREVSSQVPSLGTSPVPRPITTAVTPAGAATARVPTAPVPTASPVSKATAPIQLPSAPLPPPAARVSTAQVPLPPMRAPAPTLAAPRPSGPPMAPRPPGSPPPAPGMAATIPLAKAPGGPKPPPGVPGAALPKPPPGARVEAGATTVPLAKTPGAPKPPGGGTSPMGKGGPGPTQQLPKATVQLAKNTVPMSKAPAVTPPSAPVRRAVEKDEEYEEKDPEAGLTPLAIVSLLMSAALLVISLFTWDKPQFYASPAGDGLLDVIKVPAPVPQEWEKEQPDGTHVSTFSKLLEVQANKLK